MGRTIGKRERKSTLRFYRHVARKGWSRTQYFTYASRFRVVREWMASQLPKKRRILSIGCGSAELERRLAARGHRVVGIDVSGDMLRRAPRQRRLTLINADGNVLPFRNGSFDVVILWESIGHLVMTRVFAEARRVLRDRGLVFVTTYPSHRPAHGTYRRRTRKGAARALRQSGFRIDDRKLLLMDARRVKEVPAERQCTLVYFAATKES